MTAVASTTTATIPAADGYSFAAKGAIPAERDIFSIRDEWVPRGFGVSPGTAQMPAADSTSMASRSARPRVG